MACQESRCVLRFHAHIVLSFSPIQLCNISNDISFFISAKKWQSFPKGFPTIPIFVAGLLGFQMNFVSLVPILILFLSFLELFKNPREIHHYINSINMYTQLRLIMSLRRASDTSVRTSTAHAVIAASQNMPLFYPLPSSHHHLVSRDFCFCLNDDVDDDPFKA